MMRSKKQQSLVIFTSRDGKVAVDTRFDGETVGLSLDQMASLFERDKSTISRHIKNVLEEGELERNFYQQVTDIYASAMGNE